MLISQIVGGLGNQMFQYAAGRALALRRGTSLKLDIEHYAGPQRQPGLEQFPRAFKLPRFNIAAEVATPAEALAVRDRFRRNVLLKAVCGQVRRRWRRFAFGHYVERSANFDPVFWQLPDGTYLQGYFNSEQYFKPFEAAIRRELTPRDAALTEYARDYVDKLGAGGGRPVVSVHVRRGDMTYSVQQLKDPTLIPGPPVTPEYVAEAVARFDPGCAFLVFSDSSKDLDWCRDNLRPARGEQFHFAYGHDDLQDFAVMRACDHHVISNSTFSWWAAWLNDRPGKRVVAPRTWFYRDRYPDYRIESVVPAAWELVGLGDGAPRRA